MVWLVRLENGDGDGDDNSSCFYVAITIPQIPLSDIDGKRDLIFRCVLAALLGAGISFSLEIKFLRR